MFEFPEIDVEYTIDPLNEDKRIRVFGEQLQNTVINNTTLRSFNWSIGFYFKTGIRLIEKFPTREIELNKILIDFWKKMQIKYKLLKGE